MILLIDNFDSFVHNLARYFQRLGQETLVIRNDRIDARSARALGASAIVLSPGPCTPDEAGHSLELVGALHDAIPLLGVCLGHQVIAQALGGRVIRAPEPMHGHASIIRHAGRGVFEGVPSPMRVCRYHSLIVEEHSLPEALTATAWSGDGSLMAFEYVGRPVFGVQFHPEAILTEHGYAMLANFLRLAGLRVPEDAEQLASSELHVPQSVVATTVPPGPVTY